MYRRRMHQNVLILLVIHSVLTSPSLFGYIGKLSVFDGGGVHTVEAADDGRRKQRNQQQQRRNQQQQQPRRNKSNGSSNGNNRQNSSGGSQDQWRSRRQDSETQPTNYYKILNVKKSSKLQDIKKAYRKLALEYHVSV